MAVWDADTDVEFRQFLFMSLIFSIARSRFLVLIKEFELAGVCLMSWPSLTGLVVLCPSAIPTFFP